MALRVAITGQIQDRGVPYTVSKRRITGHPIHRAPAICSLARPERAYVVDPIHFDYLVNVRKVVSSLWPNGGIFSPRIPGGGFEPPEAIQVYLQQARDKWELLIARHQYETPHYVPPQYPAESKSEKQDGSLHRLFKRS